MDNRHDQALVGQINRDAQVDLGMHHQGIVGDRGIEEWKVPQSFHGGPRDERQVGERETLLLLESRTPRLAHPLDVLEVDFVGDERVR